MCILVLIHNFLSTVLPHEISAQVLCFSCHSLKIPWALASGPLHSNFPPSMLSKFLLTVPHPPTILFTFSLISQEVLTHKLYHRINLTLSWADWLLIPTCQSVITCGKPWKGWWKAVCEVEGSLWRVGSKTLQALRFLSA